MGECIITRPTFVPDEVLNPINPVPGYCVLVCTVKDSKGEAVSNLKIRYDSGTANLDYVTNEKGMALFTINSLSANILVNNYYNNGTRILDYDSKWYNQIEAPIGMVQKTNTNISRANSSNITKNDSFIFRDAKSVNFVLSGGAGGKGGTSTTHSNKTGFTWTGYGGSGGRGYTNRVNGLAVDTNQSYSVTLGKKGSNGRDATGASGQSDYEIAGTGGTGGTSTFLSYSAIGGSGGNGGASKNGSKYNGDDGVGGDGSSGNGYINFQFQF